MDDAQGDEENRRPDAGGFIGGQNTNQGGRTAHGDERDHEDHAASEAVGEVPGQEGADWAEQEGQANGQEGDDGGQATFERAEHEVVEHESGHRCIEEVVVPLDSGTDGRRGDDTAAFGRRNCRRDSCVRHDVIPFGMGCAIYGKACELNHLRWC